MSSESKHAELNAKKWDSRAETYDAKMFDVMRYMQERVIALLPLKENLCFLDIGCGTGWAVRRVANLVNQRGEFCGIDLSPKMLERAVENSRDFKMVHFYQGNAEELPFQDSFFDVMLCTNSFHHYLHPTRALNEIRRVLKPGGRIYIADVATDEFLTNTLDWIIKQREPEHVRFHSTREFQRFFADAQLKHVASQTINFPFKVHIGEKHSLAEDLLPAQTTPSTRS